MGSSIPLALGSEGKVTAIAAAAAEQHQQHQQQLQQQQQPRKSRESERWKPSVDVQPSKEVEASPQYKSFSPYSRSRTNSSASEAPPTLEARSPGGKWRPRSSPDGFEGPVVHPGWVGAREKRRETETIKVLPIRVFDPEEADLGMMRYGPSQQRSRSASNVSHTSVASAASANSAASSRLSQSVTMLFSLPAGESKETMGLGLSASPLQTVQEKQEFTTPRSPPTPHLQALEEGEEFPTPEIPELEEFEGLGLSIPQLPALNLGGKLDWTPPSPTIKLIDDEEFDLAMRPTHRITKKVSFSQEKEIFTPLEEPTEEELIAQQKATWGSFLFFPMNPPAAVRPPLKRQLSYGSTRTASPGRSILRRTSSFEPAHSENKVTLSPKLEQTMQQMSSKKEGRSLLRPALSTPRSVMMEEVKEVEEPMPEKLGTPEPTIDIVDVILKEIDELGPEEMDSPEPMNDMVDVLLKEVEELVAEKVEIVAVKEKAESMVVGKKKEAQAEEVLVIAAPVETEADEATESAPVSPVSPVAMESSSWPSPSSSISSMHSRNSSIISLASSQTSCFSPPQSQGCLSPPTSDAAFSPISEASSTFSPTTFSPSRFASIPLTPDMSASGPPTSSPRPDARIVVSSSPNPEAKRRGLNNPNDAANMSPRSKHWSESSEVQMRHWSMQGVGNWVRKGDVYAESWREGPTSVALGLGIRAQGKGIGLGTRAMKSGRDRSTSDAPPVPQIPKEFEVPSGV